VNYSIAQNTTPGIYYLTITNPFGTSNEAAFTVGDATPIISSLSPSVWSAGSATTVTINGEHFGTNSPTLSFSDSSISATIASYSDTQIVASIAVPSGAPSGEEVTVTVTADGYNGNSFSGISGSGQTGPSTGATATVGSGCFAQLKYRAVPHLPPGVPANHSFWYIQDSGGAQWIIDGGPSGTCPLACGYLVDWVTQGTVSSHFSQEPSLDSTGKPTAWSIGPASGQLCNQVYSMWNTAMYYWPPGGTPVTYSLTGPNSNTFAHELGTTNGDFDITTPPPDATGW
jgi:hypothetical protein